MLHGPGRSRPSHGLPAPAPWIIDATKRKTFMRYLKLIILFLAYALITPAFAQTCCPAGCVQNAPNRCVTTGPVQNSCGNTFTCPPGSPSPGGPPGSIPRQTENIPQQLCFWLNPTPALIVSATAKCVSDLTGSATFFGCFFEDDAGRAEDERTGLSCPARQAALASQCRNRCAAFASHTSTCTDSNSVWHDYFGDVSGDMVGSARVERCGPPLRDSFFRRAGRLRPQRLHP
jgi:hypothetical protein